MDDRNCSLCKANLEEIVVSNDLSLIWEEFEPKDALQDKEDKSIYYSDSKAKALGISLRSLRCLMYNCTST